VKRSKDRPRSEFVGASEFASAGGLDVHTPRWDLWAKKTNRLKDEDNRRMEKGRTMEPIVRARVGEMDVVHSVRDPEAGEFYMEDHTGCHPDGWLTMEHPTLELQGPGILEIKCPDSFIVKNIQEQGLPTQNLIQLQGTCLLAGAKWGAFAIFDANSFEDPLLFPMMLDEKLARHFQRVANQFYVDHVLTDKAPNAFPDVVHPVIPTLGGEMVYVPPEDEEWSELCEEYALIRDTRKMIELRNEGSEKKEIVGLRDRLIAKMEALETTLAQGAGWKMRYNPDHRVRRFQQKLLDEIGAYDPERVIAVLERRDWPGPDIQSLIAELDMSARLLSSDDRLYHTSREKRVQGWEVGE